MLAALILAVAIPALAAPAEPQGPVPAPRTGPDGRFSVSNVQAGEYGLTVLTGAANDQPAEEARQMIQVAGVDIDNLVVVTGSGGAVRGHVASDDGTPVPGLERLVVRARSLTPMPWMSKLGSAGNGRVNADGTFELKWLSGPVVLSIGTLTGDWTLKAVELNGRNLADDPIEVRHGETLTGVRVMLTNRPTQVRGGPSPSCGPARSGLTLAEAESRRIDLTVKK